MYTALYEHVAKHTSHVCITSVTFIIYISIEFIDCVLLLWIFFEAYHVQKSIHLAIHL